jgi:hypothetical protein
MIFQNFGFNQNYLISAPVPPPATLSRLAVSASLWAYYDIAFTESYSGSGQTKVFDLSGNNNSGSVVGSVNYNTTTISGSVLRLGASSQANRVDMPQVTVGNGQTWVLAWYMTSASYQFDATELFAGRDNEAYGMFARNNVGNACILPIINDEYGASLTPTPTNSAQSGSWHISQISFDDATNTLSYCMDGTTGSYTITTTVSTGTINPKWNFLNTSLPNRYLNSGSMMQVMALYTGSLSTAQLLENHNSLKGRYGL